jgi:uncharacterized membrane protein YkoI
MKLSMLATACAVMWSAGAVAANVPSAGALTLRQMVAHMESQYQGEVVAIALDAGGDKAAHYHVDMRYPTAGMAKLDVDATTLEIASRVQPLSEVGWTSLPGATALAATQLRGQVIAAELDSIDGTTAHYDVDVRLPGGELARLKVDAKTQQLGWRTPPIMTH